MKIGITCYPTYGGSGVVATELGTELAQRGHEVHFITYQQPFRLDPDQPNIHFHQVYVKEYPLFEYPPYDLALATRMGEVAEAYDLDLLHVHYAIPHSASALLARQMLATSGRHLPFVTTLHGTDITLVGADPTYLPITRYSIAESDGVTSISQYLKDETSRVFGINRDIEVIPNFVNLEIYKPNTSTPERRLEFAEQDERILVHLSNFRPVKRVTDVVEVFARVATQIPSKLLMIGDGPDRESAEQLAHERGVASRIHFLGKQDRVHELLALADVMLLPSQLESFGLAALEAMACGAIPVTSRVGGLPEVITHEHDGFMAELGNVEQMAKYAVSVLNDDVLLSRMRKAARETAERRFSAASIIPRYEQYYRKILERNVGKRSAA